MTTESTERRNGRYWYDTDHGDIDSVAVLDAVRRHRDAESAMQRRTRELMKMGENDLRALRWIIASEQRAEAPRSAVLARALGISSAATAKLVARLVAGGYVARATDSADARAVVLRTVPGAHARLRSTLGPMHERMLRLAESLSEEQRRTVIDFFDELAGIVADVAIVDAASAAGRTPSAEPARSGRAHDSTTGRA